jgi:hypothetical protein
MSKNVIIKYFKTFSIELKRRVCNCLEAGVINL